MKFVLYTVALLILISCSTKKKNIERIDPTDSLIQAKMKEARIVGLGAAVFVNKKPVWMKGYGYSDKENNKAFTVNTIMNIGSISKTFTGACLMRAVDENKLSLDEDINTYVPFHLANPYFPNEKITLRNLATHTSTIHDIDSVYSNSYHYGGDATEPLGDFLKNYLDPKGKYYAKENFLNAKPGKHYEYSNIAAGLAGYIIELRTGEPLNQYSKQFIFNPLKMDSTGWFIREVNMSNHSKLYYYKKDSLKAFDFYGITTYPDGGVRTSVSDLTKFFVSLLNGGETNGVRILKKESVYEMQRPQFTESSKPDNRDLAKSNSGIFWSIRDGGTRIGHTGSDPGVATVMHYDPTKDVGIIMFINTELDEKSYPVLESMQNELWRKAKSVVNEGGI